MKFRFEVPGMTCGGCARTIVAAIKGVDAQAEVDTDVPGRIVRVDTGRDSDPLIAAIKAAGYDARLG
ncbi:heavy metal transporter [Sphingopyxis bauzanensis]|uniref:Heavy metal transporter n=2 Tax=Sphingopyxis bauzanensis TaxID=651663 RepID=A0A246JVS2_9SPHN|nr:heavy metal transporter [Sphingopyxis bauzanensis]